MEVHIFFYWMGNSAMEIINYNQKEIMQNVIYIFLKKQIGIDAGLNTL